MKYASDDVYATREAAAILTDGNERGGDTVILAYQYYEDARQFNETHSADGLRRFLDEHEFADPTIIDRQAWDYFPRFTSDAIQAGAPWTLIEKQGIRSTWYIGSSVSFESVEAVLEFNHFMLDHMATG